jgi:hypothetical protein
MAVAVVALLLTLKTTALVAMVVVALVESIMEQTVLAGL